AGVCVEERFFLDGITLHSADISPGDVKLARAIEPHFADARLAFRDGALLSAGVTTQSIALERLDEVWGRRVDVRFEDGFERGQPASPPILRPFRTLIHRGGGA